MRILLLAPHPFFQERGTPISVELMLRVWAARGDTVHLLTFHEGRDVEHHGLTLHRIPAPPLVRGIRPGFSWKKVVCDLWMLPHAFQLCSRFRPDVVHAGEESVFMARLLQLRFGVPYVYDMDSVLSDQMGDKFAVFRWLAPLLRAMERWAVRPATLVLTVCPALVHAARDLGARRVAELRDVSLLDIMNDPNPAALDDCPLRGFRFLYIGNFERYQGVRLLVDAFERAARQNPEIRLILVGGAPAHVDAMRRHVAEAGLADRVWLAGPRPLKDLAAVMAKADVLVSPRLLGDNTPLKIYSYLDSGKPVLATNLPTHTDVLPEGVALLAAPDPAALSEAMLRLAGDPELCRELGEEGRAFARRHHSFATFHERFAQIYRELDHAVDRKAR